MKSKRNVYCEYRFWNRFFEKESQDEILKDRSARRLWDEFCLFLEDSILNFDIQKNEVDPSTLGGKALMDFFQKRGGANINFLSENYPSLSYISNSDDELLNSVYLTEDSTEYCNTMSQKKGVLVFNLEMVFSASHVYVNNGESLSRENGITWNYLLTFKEKNPSISYCNSLVIADRYLFFDKKDKNGNYLKNNDVFNYNLRPILQALLPDSLDNDICFNICILTEKQCENIEEKTEQLQSMIAEIRPNLVFSTNIYNSRKLHDRSILTNNILLTSGAGFDVIGDKNVPLKFTTTMLIFPFLEHNNKDNEYYIEWIKNILKEEDKCQQYQKNYWGQVDRDHHLLDYYYEAPAIPRSTFTLGNAALKTLFSAIG